MSFDACACSAQTAEMLGMLGMLGMARLLRASPLSVYAHKPVEDGDRNSRMLATMHGVDVRCSGCYRALPRGLVRDSSPGHAKREPLDLPGCMQLYAHKPG
ncbi:hypothetical protein DIE13_08925 [Burkholderia sp. Bp9016]|nr:hypothetical protein DIE13_08925 [Burkholderia sp. Bp9016]